jgi:hypothetical protein
MRWAEVSLLELIVSENSKFYPLKLEMRNSGLVLLVLVLVFWYRSKIGFDFLENLSIEKFLSRFQKMRYDKAHFPRYFLVKNSSSVKSPNFLIQFTFLDT